MACSFAGRLKGDENMTADKMHRGSFVASCTNSTVEVQIDLPIEVVVHIMKYLPLSDRTSAGQVCRIWNEASRDLKFVSKETVLLHDDMYRPMQVFENGDYRILHLVLKSVELTGSKVDEFFDHYCSDLRSLSIQNCDLSGKSFVEILKRCTQLESLGVISCRELLISGRILDVTTDVEILNTTLVNLRTLNLDSNRYLSDSLFNRFVGIAPNIDTLSLSNCQISFHTGLYKKFYPTKLSDSGTTLPSESVLTFHNILQYIELQSHKIKRLKFGNTLLDNTALGKLAELPKLRLETFEAQECNQLSNVGILAITQYQKTLTKLDLSKCSRIVDHSVQSICKNLTNLTSLNLKRCRGITNESVAELSNLKKLVELDLSYCELVNSTGIKLGLCSWVNVAFRRLSLTALTLDEETICHLSVSLPRLEHLDLCWCFNSVTDQSIQAICQNLVWLRSLKLVACDKLTDAGLTGMGMGNKQNSSYHKLDSSKETQEMYGPSRDQDVSKPILESRNQFHNISLRSKAEQDIVNDAKRKEMVSQMCEDQYLKMTGSGYSLANLKGLQFLDLMGCNRITDVSLKYAFHFRELRHLNLGQCQQITHAGLAHVAANNPSIESLGMSKCYNITDDVVISISKSLTRLKNLDLQSCNRLTDRSLVAIGRHCTRLQHLDVSQCHCMSLEEAENLEHVVPTLRSLINNGLSLKWQPPEPRLPTKAAPKPPPLGLRFFLKR